MTLQTPLRTTRGYDVWLLVGRTNLKVHRALNNLLAGVDLSLAQHEVLVHIHRDRGLSQKELSERLLVVKSNVSALIKKLEARDLVRRAPDPDDARNNQLFLTDSGEELVQESFALQNRVVDAMVAVMSDAELEMIGDVMQRVSHSLDQLDT